MFVCFACIHTPPHLVLFVLVITMSRVAISSTVLVDCDQKPVLTFDMIAP